jgi:hypothetical protein
LDFGDLYTEDSAPVVLNCRTDAVRDQLHKTLRQLFDFDVELGRNFFQRYLTAPSFVRRLTDFLSGARTPIG